MKARAEGYMYKKYTAEQRHEIWNKASIRYKKRYPERHRARWMVRNAIMNGVLTRLPCLVCGDSPSHAHHEDYSRPLDVTWLCASHHRTADIERRGRQPVFN